MSHRKISNESMIDPITRIRFQSEYELETWFPVGVLDGLMMALIVSYVGFEERVRTEPFHRYADLSRLEGIELDFHDIVAIAAERCEASSKIAPVKSAIFADTKHAHEVGSLFAQLMEPSPITVRVFRTVEECAQWMEVPVSALSERD
jgi:hypothetical protein